MMMRDMWESYRHQFRDHDFRVAVGASLACFIASMVFIYYAIGYATNKASNYVTDIVLSNIPAFDVGWLFVNGTFLFVLIAAAATARKPNRIPFTLFALALFFFIRGVFISITHLAPFPLEGTQDPGTIFSRIFYGSDQFFSGHTGAPFLFTLMYWHRPVGRYIFLGWSLFFATIVLLGHLHYSIDVLAAFFITYTIFEIAKYTFPRSYARFLGSK